MWDIKPIPTSQVTGRKDKFTTLTADGRPSADSRMEESDCDAFDTGHSSTSISVALGMVKARD